MCVRSINMKNNKSIILLMCVIAGVIVAIIIYKYYYGNKIINKNYTKEQVVKEFYENKDKFERIVEYAKEEAIGYNRNCICIRKIYNTNEIEYLHGEVEPIKDDAEYLINNLGYSYITEITNEEFSRGADIKIIKFLKSANYDKRQGLICRVNGSFPRGNQPEDSMMELIEKDWYYFLWWNE